MNDGDTEAQKKRSKEREAGNKECMYTESKECGGDQKRGIGIPMNGSK